MKGLARIALAGVVLAIMAAMLYAADLAKSGSFERTITVKNTGATSTTTEKYYWELDRMRIEKYTTDGLVVQIKNGRIEYLYSPADKTAIKIVVPEKYAKSVQQVLGEGTEPVKNGKKVGTAKVAGIPCTVYSVPGAPKGHSLKIYVSTDSRLPMPLKVIASRDNRSETFETRNVKLNYNVRDTLFALPKGTKIKEREFPDMPKGHPPVQQNSKSGG